MCTDCYRYVQLLPVRLLMFSLTKCLKFEDFKSMTSSACLTGVYVSLSYRETGRRVNCAAAVVMLACRVSTEEGRETRLKGDVSDN